MIDLEYRTLHLKYKPDTVDPYDHRTALMNETILEAKNKGKIKEIVRLGEPVTIYTPDGEPVCEMSTLGTKIFSNVAFTVQLIV
jgi:hypothetical protein